MARGKARSRRPATEPDHSGEGSDDGGQVTGEVDLSVEATEIDPNNYEQDLVVVVYDRIAEPRWPSRSVTPEHVASLQSAFSSTGNRVSIGTISVLLADEAMKKEDVVKDGVVDADAKLMLVDGRHRLRALGELRKGSERWVAECAKLKVSLWTRTDGKHISDLEALGLAAYLNSSSSTVLAPSFKDMVQAAISTIQVILARDEVELKDIKVKSLAGVLARAQSVGRLGQRQLERYSLIALRLAGSTRARSSFEEVCESSDKFTLVHVASKELVALDDRGFCMCMLALKYRMEIGMEGSFEHVRRAFFQCAAQIMRELYEVADFFSWEIKELLSTEICITAHKKLSLVQFICKKLARFSVVRNQEAADNNRLVAIRKRLSEIVGMDVSRRRVADDETGAEAGEVQEGEGGETGNVGEAGDAEEAGGAGEGGEAGDEREVAEARKEPERVEPRERAEPREREGRDAPVEDEESSEEAVRRKPKTKQVISRPKVSKKRVRYAISDSESDSFTRSKRIRKKAAVRKRKVRASGTVQRSELVKALKDMPKAEVVELLGTIDLEVVALDEDEDGEEGDDQSAFRATDGAFDDTVPSELPIGATEPEEYEGEGGLGWLRFMRKEPSRWPLENPIKNVTAYLEMLHIPQGHRSHVFIQDVDVLAYDHHVVYWRAAYNYYMQYGLGDVSADEENLADNEWDCVVKEDLVAHEYFAVCREKVKGQGFCVLQGFLDDANVPKSYVGLETDGTWDKSAPGILCRDYDKLRLDVLKSFPSVADMDSGKNKSWNYIINRGDEEDFEDGRVGAARYTTTRFGVMDDVEQDGARVWNAKARALLDLRIAHAVAALKLNDNREDQKMFVPRTGGRWLLTAKDCKRQQLHTDFVLNYGGDYFDETKNPGYFALCSGKEEVPVWICMHSHRIVASTSHSNIRALSRGMVVNMIRIPPYSIFVGRGDVFHAGHGFDDYEEDSGMLRYHMYFVPDGVSLPDGVHLLHAFRPTFVTEADEDGDTERRAAASSDMQNVHTEGPGETRSDEDGEEPE